MVAFVGVVVKEFVLEGILGLCELETVNDSLKKFGSQRVNIIPLFLSLVESFENDSVS